jgi:alanyl-tRNA synthetase
MTTNELRQKFLNYFQLRKHQPVNSSSLVPDNDPTLLFTNAGMVQFKEVFLGLDPRSYQRAVSSQRCVRAGGKHNDLENVGYTARHHTFFEMLGNFSFGDYFKREAIQYAWDFLTNELQLPPEKLWVTVFEDDDEAADIWLNEMGVDKKRFSRCGEADNFWAMGDTGPCGPCSEIFYDHGESIEGGPPGSPEQEGDRYVEIWNLVFMQYDRDGEGNLNPIPKPSVDTGMGLERIAAVMQGVSNNYDIDLFQSLLAAINNLCEKPGIDIISARVVADHIRSCAFLICDGVVPSNEGRGYVLRRIIRRAARHGHKLGFNKPFFHRLVAPLAELMGDAFPELPETQEFVERTLRQEELRFAETLDHGLRHLEDILANLKDKRIAGEDVFKLYDTYGFPMDLTADIARERGLTLDKAGFDKAMAAQRKLAQSASKFAAVTNDESANFDYESTFSGYEKLVDESTVIALFKGGNSANTLQAGDEGGIVLDATPFYAESGGQIGDSGKLIADGIVFEVRDTQKLGSAHLHLGELKQGSIAVEKKLKSRVNPSERVDIVRNHSATHLLHAALRKILGKHVNQKGSLVAVDKLRFDFSHPEALTDTELRKIEALTNSIILENKATSIKLMSLDEAMNSGAMSLFGEKYANEVRVLNIGGDFSTELCGGTHVLSSGDIGLFKILSETGIAAGVRRIEAVTGQGALIWVRENESKLVRIAQLLKSDRDSIELRLESMLERSRKLEKEVDQLKSKLASSAGDDMASDAIEIAGIKVLTKYLEGVDPKTLRETVDQLKNKLGSSALVLATVKDNKVSLVAGVSKDSTDKIKAGELVNFVAQQVGGKGGGRADMAQAGGNDADKLDAALASVPDWVTQQINS